MAKKKTGVRPYYSTEVTRTVTTEALIIMWPESSWFHVDSVFNLAARADAKLADSELIFKTVSIHFRMPPFNHSQGLYKLQKHVIIETWRVTSNR